MKLLALLILCSGCASSRLSWIEAYELGHQARQEACCCQKGLRP